MRTGTGDSRPPGPAGFTLVEMIVALAIFATVMTVVFATLIFQQRSFAVQGDRIRVQRQLRNGIKVLEGELRNAGSGLPLRQPVSIPSGWDGGSPVSVVSGLAVTDGGSDGPDTLVVARTLSSPVPLTRGMTTAASDLAVGAGIRWAPGMLGVIYDRTGAEIFRVTRVDGGTLLQHGSAGIFRGELSKPYAQGASVARILLAGYAVSVPDGPGVPSLVRREIARDGTLRDRTVAEGVFDLQVRLMMPDGTERDAGRVGSDPSALYMAAGARILLAARGRLAGESRPWRMEAVVGFRNRGSAL
jgi:prepilin-type N-terminal cleavage/methylation domain-containing protein